MFSTYVYLTMMDSASGIGPKMNSSMKAPKIGEFFGHIKKEDGMY